MDDTVRWYLENHSYMEHNIMPYDGSVLISIRPGQKIPLFHVTPDMLTYYRFLYDKGIILKKEAMYASPPAPVIPEVDLGDPLLDFLQDEEEPETEESEEDPITLLAKEVHKAPMATAQRGRKPKKNATNNSRYSGSG